MKLLKYLFLFLVSFALMACNDTQTTTTATHEWIQLNENESDYEFQVGDTVPDWNQYFEFINPESVKSFTINSDFSFVTTFNQAGEFSVQVRITLQDDSVVFETFTVTVTESTDNPEGSIPWVAPADAVLVDTDGLNSLVSVLEMTTYFSTTTSGDVVLDTMDELITFNIESEIKSMMDEETFSYVYYLSTDYTGTDFSFSRETFTTLSANGISVALNSDDTGGWQFETMSFEDYLQMDPGISMISQSELLYGLDQVYSKSYEDYIEYYIPLSSDNYSLGSTPDILDLLYSLDMLTDDTPANKIPLIEENYDKIHCVIVTNLNQTAILGIRYEFREFLNLAQGILDPGIEVDYLKAELAYLSFSTSPFTLEYPEGYAGEPVALLEAGLTYFNVEKEINYSAVDTDNKNIYYSLKGDHYLYSFNYLTFETRQVYFEILPDHIYYRDNQIYVSLSDGHKYYWPLEEQYGGFGIVNAITFEKTKEFDLAFDPFSVAVDEDGFIYISSGSHQHSNLYSISPVSGQVISTRWGVYYSGEILYSDYTGRLYYFELMTTQDEITMYEVDRGVFGTIQSGEDGFNENYLTLSPDGRYLYTGNGIGFQLNTTLGSDGRTLFNVGQGFYHVGIDSEAHEYYFSEVEMIVHTDSNYQVIDMIPYGGVSNNLFYDQGKLINIGDSTLEIMDLVNTDSTNIFYVTNATYNSSFNPSDFLDNAFYTSVEYTLVSGSLDTTVLGQTILVYNLTEVAGVPTEGTITLIVNVIDNQAPLITISPDVEHELIVNSAFTPPTCQVTDNYDASVTCEIVENNVDPTVIGTYTVVYESFDSSGNRGELVVSFEVNLPRVEVDLTTYTFNGIIGDAVYDINSDSLFYILYNTKQIVKYNVLTSVEERITFDYFPETLTMYDGFLYVTIIHQEHSPYWWEEDQTGEIAIINMATFELSSQFVIPTDPYAIAVTEDYIYVYPGSGQWVKIVAIEQANPSNSYFLSLVREKTKIAYATDSAYIFGITTDTSPQSLYRYQLDGTTTVSLIDDPGHGDYSYGEMIFASPYLDYVFAENGKIFYQLQTINHSALDFAKDMGFTISAMYFDQTDHSTYFGQNNGFVYISYATDYKVSEEMYTGYKIDKIYEEDGIIYIVSYTSGDQVTLVVAERP